MKGILLLFYEPYPAGTRDSEKTLNADINEIKVDINGIPNMLFSQGMKKEDLWKAIWNKFGKENSSMTETKFYAGGKYGVFIADLRSMSDNNLHGSGLKLINTKDGVNLTIKRATEVSGNVKFHIFILSEARFRRRSFHEPNLIP